MESQMKWNTTNAFYQVHVKKPHPTHFIKGMKVDPCLTSHTKFKSNCVKDSSIRLDSIKFLRENTVESFLTLALAIIVLDVTLQAQVKKAKIEKWDYRIEKVEV